MDGQTLLHELLEIRWPQVPSLVTGWEWAAVVTLTLAVVFMVLVEDWRLSLLAWVAVGIAVAVLLVRVIPVPWALSRMLAASLDGALLWLGARRWPRAAPLRPGGGIWVRLPALAVAAIIIWQAQPYIPVFWADVARANMALVLVVGGLLLIGLSGDTLHATLGFLLWLNATALILGALPIPTDWFLLLTVLDITVCAAASVGLASEGAGARWARHRGES